VIFRHEFQALKNQNVFNTASTFLGNDNQLVTYSIAEETADIETFARQ